MRQGLFTIGKVVWLCASMSLVCISSVIGQLDEFSFESIDGLPSSSRPSDILQDSRGFYWFSYEERGQGLFVYDGETLDHIPAKAYDSTALPDPNVCFLHELPNGHILMGTTARGLVEYDPESGKFEQIPIPTREGQIRRVNRVLEEHDDLLWLGCVGGLVKYVPSTRQSEVYKGTFDFEHERFSDPGNRIHALAQDPVDPDVIWLGNIMGLTSFHKSTGTFEQWVLPYIGIEEVGLPNTGYLILSLAFANDSILLAGTWSGGIMALDTRKGLWTRFRDDHVNPLDDLYYQMERIDETRVWVASNRGFGVYNWRKQLFQIYERVPSARHYVRGLYATTTFEVLDEDRIIVLGFTGGVKGVRTHGSGEASELFPPRIINAETIEDGQRIQVQMHQNQITLLEEYSSLFLDVRSPGAFDPESVEYQYKVGSGARSWESVNGLEQIGIDKFPGSQFIVKLRASVDGNNWIESDDIKVIRRQHFWTTSEFRMGIVALLVLTVISYLWITSRQKRKQRELKREYELQLAESEMSALRAQMNPHFIFNSLNSIKMHVMKQDTHLANKYLTKFSHLMRMVLRNSEKKLITLTDEINALELYIGMEKLRFDDGFDSDVNTMSDLDTEDLFIPPMIIQPYVENAIWHGLMHKKNGEKGLLTISFEAKPDRLIVCVEDNGVGRNNNQSQTKPQDAEVRRSYGMRITSERLALLKNSLNIDATVVIEDLKNSDGVALGTKVILALPIIHSKEAKLLMS